MGIVGIVLGINKEIQKGNRAEHAGGAKPARMGRLGIPHWVWRTLNNIAP